MAGIDSWAKNLEVWTKTFRDTTEYKRNLKTGKIKIVTRTQEMNSTTLMLLTYCWVFFLIKH